MLKAYMLDKSTLGDDIDISPLHKSCELTAFENTGSDELISRVKEAEILIVNKIKLTKEVLENAPDLKLICVTATGYDNVDVSYCKEKGIAVCNVVNYSTNSVAQVTVAIVLNLFNKMKNYERYVTSGLYTKSKKANCLQPVFNELYGKTWGIVGFGNIGKKVAEIAQAFGCKIQVCKQTPVDSFECVDINTLCKNSDIITVHTPLTTHTRKLIGASQIELMNKNTILVNTARGAVIDEYAITEAIKNNLIAGFGTDVYEFEPFSEEHPYNEILSYDNVCFTPHMAWGAHEARNRCICEISENIISFEKGEIRNRVDCEKS